MTKQSTQYNYDHSEKGKARRKRYETTEKARARQKRYYLRKKMSNE